MSWVTVIRQAQHYGRGPAGRGLQVRLDCAISDTPRSRPGFYTPANGIRHGHGRWKTLALWYSQSLLGAPSSRPEGRGLANCFRRKLDGHLSRVVINLIEWVGVAVVIAGHPRARGSLAALIRVPPLVAWQRLCWRRKVTG